jgi:hypothetical protein
MAHVSEELLLAHVGIRIVAEVIAPLACNRRISDEEDVTAVLVVAFSASLSGLAAAGTFNSGRDLSHVVGEYSFGWSSQLYNQGTNVVVSSPYITNNTDGTLTIEGIRPISHGCDV